MSKNLIIILGPTGIGKTSISIKIASEFKTSIISCDSRQFYREMKIGTAAPTVKELTSIKHYLVGNKSVLDYYNVYQFEQDALAILKELYVNNNVAIMAGGSGMYIDVICNGIDDIPDIETDLRNNLINKYEGEGIESLRFDLKKLDPEFYKIVDLKNKNRMLRAIEVKIQTGKSLLDFRKNRNINRDFNIIKIGLRRDREELYNRINARVDMMVKEGLIQEVKSLLPYRNENALKTVGYREIFDFLDEKITQEKAIELVKRNTRHYAKRQITWFKRDKAIHWFHPDSEKEIINCIERNLK